MAPYRKKNVTVIIGHGVRVVPPAVTPLAYKGRSIILDTTSHRFQPVTVIACECFLGFARECIRQMDTKERRLLLWIYLWHVSRKKQKQT